MNVIDKEIVDKSINNILLHLQKFGGIKNKTLKTLIRYIFLINFIDQFGYTIPDSDYMIIDDFARKILTNCGCLIQFPIQCTDGIKTPMSVRMTSNLRVSEDNVLRLTETNLFRKAL